MLVLSRRRAVSLLALLALLSAAAVTMVASSDAAPKTKKIEGRMINISNFFPPQCTSVTGICSRFTAKGDIKGDGTVFIDSAPAVIDKPPIAYSAAHTVIVTKKGNLACNEAALFDVAPGDHAFVDLCLIDGAASTGKYAGATGYIQESGTFDFAGNLGELEYIGSITYAEGARELDD